MINKKFVSTLMMSIFILSLSFGISIPIVFAGTSIVASTDSKLSISGVGTKVLRLLPEYNVTTPDLTFEAGAKATTVVNNSGPAVITGDIECANITTNESINITRNESVTITIHEAWPTFLSTAKDITYVGPGISTREEYENNGDVICTSFDVKGLTKTARFDTVLLGTSISAEVRPGCVNETICTNKSSYYTLSSISLGGSAHIGCRLGEGIGRVESSETYIGIFKIETAIKMEERIPPAPQNASNASIDWMPCTSSSEP